jgi:putrescine transport system permease protein
MRIYSQVRLGVTPEINAICTILIGLVSAGVLAAAIVSRRREQERQRAERLAAAMP